MRPVEIVGLMLGILLAMDVTSHLPVAYSNMLRALEESTAAEDLLHQLGSQARYISIFLCCCFPEENKPIFLDTGLRRNCDVGAPFFSHFFSIAYVRSLDAARAPKGVAVQITFINPPPHINILLLFQDDVKPHLQELQDKPMTSRLYSQRRRCRGEKILKWQTQTLLAAMCS